MTLSELKAFRQHIHKHPELSTEEKETQQYIYQKLRDLGVEDIRKVGGTGVAAYFKSGNAGPKILLRSDHDALPIQEINKFEHRSVNNGVAHVCGHDGHTAIMMGVAAHLQENPIKRGEVCLVFQPAEENGYGARAILNDPNFNFEANKAFALHNLPGYPLHQVVCKQGIFTAAAKSVIFKLKGMTSHAAEPELGKNPGLAVSEILQLGEQLSQKDIERDDFGLVTTVYLTLGEKSYGVSAGYAEVHLTLRSWQNDVMDQLADDLVQQTRKICEKYELGLEEEWLEIFSANQNDEQAFELVQKTAQQEGLDFKLKQTGFKWGEDFGLYTERFKGAMFGIGAGKNSPALHNPDYDFPDEIIETGIRMFTGILNNALR